MLTLLFHYPKCVEVVFYSILPSPICQFLWTRLQQEPRTLLGRYLGLYRVVWTAGFLRVRGVNLFRELLRPQEKTPLANASQKVNSVFFYPWHIDPVIALFP